MLTLDLNVGVPKPFTSSGVPGTPAPSYSQTRSLDFDGTDDVMTCGNVATLNSATNFSISIWARNESTPIGSGNRTYFKSGVGTVIRIRKGNSGEVRFHIGGTQISTTGTHPITQNAWQHIMVTVNGSTGKIFLNGVLRVTGTSFPTPASDSGNSFTIANYPEFPSFYNGQIDEFAIWNATLSDGGVSQHQTATQDVAAIYNSGVPTDLSQVASYDTDRTGNLKQWWRMEEGSGTSVVNTANSGTNDGTISGATFSTNIPS